MYRYLWTYILYTYVCTHALVAVAQVQTPAVSRLQLSTLLGPTVHVAFCCLTSSSAYALRLRHQFPNIANFTCKPSRDALLDYGEVLHSTDPVERFAAR